MYLRFSILTAVTVALVFAQPPAPQAKTGPSTITDLGRCRHSVNFER